MVPPQPRNTLPLHDYTKIKDSDAVFNVQICMNRMEAVTKSAKGFAGEKDTV
jgi:hypothetical protein